MIIFRNNYEIITKKKLRVFLLLSSFSGLMNIFYVFQFYYQQVNYIFANTYQNKEKTK